MLKVYVAGPISKGNLVNNINQAMIAAEELLNLGFAPFVPHLYCFWNMAYPHDYETWMKLDLEWLKHCDVLLRLPGESEGADREVSYAEEKGKPVFHSIAELREWDRRR